MSTQMIGAVEVAKALNTSKEYNYRVIRELNSELREQGIATSRARSARSICWSATLAERPRGEPSNVGNPG